jgi:uncharacterized delta-60 repeat protein
MKYLKALLLVPALLALCVGTGVAKAPPRQVGLDLSFGHGGTNTVAVPKGELPVRGFAVADGRVYVLQGFALLAFEADGKVARDFGKNGRVIVTPAATAGEGEPKGLAVDSRGRILVTGSVYLGNQLPLGSPPAYTAGYGVEDAYVIRFLPDGDRDVTFGRGGEVVSDFGLPRPTRSSSGVELEKPSVEGTSIIVDSQDRPIIGGQFEQSANFCAAYLDGTRAPFVARLTASGALDTTFAGKGYELAGEQGAVTVLGQIPGGTVATFSQGYSCGPRTDAWPSLLSSFTESGEASPGLDPNRPALYMKPAMAIDPSGRILVVQIPSLFSEKPLTLVRLQPNGDLDTSFGKNGGVSITAGLEHLGSAFTVDAKGRPILAGGNERIELRRLKTNGKIDLRFGPKGRLTAKGEYPEAVALDSRGRIYTASFVRSPTLKTSVGIEVARFIPGS